MILNNSKINNLDCNDFSTLKILIKTMGLSFTFNRAQSFL